MIEAIAFLEHTFGSAAHDLALEEALLDCAEAGQCQPLLRIWQPTSKFVVLGYANRLHNEVNLSASMPVFRRCSGGGTVLQDPGCLNYALVLRAEGPLESISGANCFIMKRNAEALTLLVGQKVEVRGHTDLCIGHHKVSGNSQRRKRNWLLFHGCFLLHADIAAMARVLKSPTRQPDYRQSRPHADFVRNLDIAATDLIAALREAWNATQSFAAIPKERIDVLVREKYSLDAWNKKW